MDLTAKERLDIRSFQMDELYVRATRAELRIKEAGAQVKELETKVKELEKIVKTSKPKAPRRRRSS